MAVYHLSDEELLGLTAQGNMGAFGQLIERHKDRVYRVVYRMVGHEQDAQDLAQDVFLRAYRSLHTFRGDARFTTWLHRLTVNLTLDWLRSRGRRPVQVPLETEGDDGSTYSHIPSDEPTPEEQVLRQQRRQELLAAVEGLSPDYREVVVLHHFQGLSYQSIAERLGCPVRTVETRLYRARQQLKRVLMEGGEGHAVHGNRVATGTLPER
jgi:RNA polymerase sigma factor (sigma-70 family)